MLTPDHPGLNWFPQDLRNPGAALSDRPVGQGLRRDAPSAQEVGLGPPGNSGDAGGMEGCPKSAPSPSCSASLASLFPHKLEASRGPAGMSLSVSPRPGVWRNAAASAASDCVPRSLQNSSLVLSDSPNPQRSQLLPGALEPQEAGERWNVRCLRSEPKFDLSWVEMRGKWPRTTRSFTSFPDLAAAGAGLPNPAGFGQDICSSAGHKAHLDLLRELRAIKFS